MSQWIYVKDWPFVKPYKRIHRRSSYQKRSRMSYFLGFIDNTCIPKLSARPKKECAVPISWATALTFMNK